MTKDFGVGLAVILAGGGKRRADQHQGQRGTSGKRAEVAVHSGRRTFIWGRRAFVWGEVGACAAGGEVGGLRVQSREAALVTTGVEIAPSKTGGGMSR